MFGGPTQFRELMIVELGAWGVRCLATTPELTIRRWRAYADGVQVYRARPTHRSPDNDGRILSTHLASSPEHNMVNLRLKRRPVATD